MPGYPRQAVFIPGAWADRAQHDDRGTTYFYLFGHDRNEELLDGWAKPKPASDRARKNYIIIMPTLGYRFLHKVLDWN